MSWDDLLEVSMGNRSYRSLPVAEGVSRRNFLRIGGIAAGAGLVLGSPSAWARQQASPQPPLRPKTNIDEALKLPRTPRSLPGPFPGRVVEIHDPAAAKDGKANAAAVSAMIRRGIEGLTGLGLEKSFALFFKPNDVVGIKVNPVGPGMISTHLEVVAAVIDWLKRGGIKPGRIVIWDRFDYMLSDAGFTPERFPGVRIEGLQTMDEAAAEGKSLDNSRWLRPDGTHVSADRFDPDVYYFADIDGPKDMPYLNQHVFNGKYSYFGKLLTRQLTKIINIPVFKNTGNGISMATKNLGYGAICNTNRLHQPLFFDVCTEVLAFPVIRDKLALSITDGLRGQYDGGPMPAPQFGWDHARLYFASDVFALDATCHALMVEKRKAMGIKVNEHPRFSEYLRYGERLGLGIADTTKIKFLHA